MARTIHQRIVGEFPMDTSVPNFTTPLVAVRGFALPRLVVYSAVLPGEQLVKFLGHDPRAQYRKHLKPEIREVYDKVQRPTSKGRRESIAGYLTNRLSSHGRVLGAFPAISVGCMEPLEFKPIEGYAGLGVLQVGEELRIVLDGLGRCSGVLDVFDEFPELIKMDPQKGRGFTMQINIFAPAKAGESLTIAEFGQLFMDFNFRVYPVPQALAISLDESDLYIQLANAIAQQPPIADHGGMEKRTASLGRKSEALVVQSVLLRVVRGACEGREFQESNLAHLENPNLTDETFDAERDRIVAFFSDLASRMGDRWADRNGVHLTSPGWQALGIICHDLDRRGLTISPLDRSAIIQTLAGIDWSREIDRQPSPLWQKDVGVSMALNKHREVVLAGAGRSSTQAIINYLRKITGLQARLDAKPKEEVSANAASLHQTPPLEGQTPTAT
jgi:DGQHR domain-containing protein